MISFFFCFFFIVDALLINKHTHTHTVNDLLSLNSLALSIFSVLVFVVAFFFFFAYFITSCSGSITVIEAENAKSANLRIHIDKELHIHAVHTEGALVYTFLSIAKAIRMNCGPFCRLFFTSF